MNYVYVIEAQDGSVKVGVSKDPVRRLNSLSTGSNLELRLHYTEAIEESINAFKIERIIHKSLKEHRIRGEWFDVPASVATAAIWDALFGNKR